MLRNDNDNNNKQMKYVKIYDIQKSPVKKEAREEKEEAR